MSATAGLRARREEFWANAEIATPDECWLWKGRQSGGYAYISGSPITKTAHRTAYEIWVGDIPDGYPVDHLCRNTLCVNPFHLEAVTTRENCLRGMGITAQNARKTHCKNGHPFSPENIYWRRDRNGERTWRMCRTCHNAVEYRRRARLASLVGEAEA